VAGVDGWVASLETFTLFKGREEGVYEDRGRGKFWILDFGFWIDLRGFDSHSLRFCSVLLIERGIAD
jgi:hypothetical protein